MASATHQTINLSRGKHRSPAEGACVMELASMLAGESFTDHPGSVCPVIGSLLRSYNDFTDDRRRQSLYGYAARVVGSLGSAVVESARAGRLGAWIGELEVRRRRRFFRLPPLQAPIAGCDLGLGARAVRAMRPRSDEMHAEVLALLDELLAIGTAGMDDRTLKAELAARGDRAGCDVGRSHRRAPLERPRRPDGEPDGRKLTVAA